MDSDEIIEVCLGGSHLESDPEPLGHLASVGTEIVKPNYLLLGIFKGIMYVKNILKSCVCEMTAMLMITC